MSFEYKQRGSMVECSKCEGDYLMLNEIGLCADCTSSMSPEKIRAMVGTDFIPEPVIEKHYTTIHRPVPSLWRMVFVCVPLTYGFSKLVSWLAGRDYSWF